MSFVACHQRLSNGRDARCPVFISQTLWRVVVSAAVSFTSLPPGRRLSILPSAPRTGTFMGITGMIAFATVRLGVPELGRRFKKLSYSPRLQNSQ